MTRRSPGIGLALEIPSSASAVCRLTGDQGRRLIEGGERTDVAGSASASVRVQGRVTAPVTQRTEARAVDVDTARSPTEAHRPRASAPSRRLRGRRRPADRQVAERRDPTPAGEIFLTMR